MKAKDTVMTTYGFNLNGVSNEVPIKEIIIKEIIIDLPGFLSRQAEISFKAGYDEGIEAGDYCEGLTEGRHIGIKEVVGWLPTCMLNLTYDTNAERVAYRDYRVYDSDWQSKLKEWFNESPSGVEE